MRHWKFTLGATVLVAVAASAVVFLYRGQAVIGETAGAAPTMMAMPVPVTKVVKRTVPIYLEYSARTESIRNITLQAKVAGYIDKQHVRDGSDVKEGDLLYSIDPRDFQAALDQAKAQKLRDEAALDYARLNRDRGTTLVQNGYLAKDAFDQRTSTLKQAEAALAMDEASIRTAQLNLGYTEIRAPFNGRLGHNQAPVGTMVMMGGTTLNTLVQLDPIYVTFNPAETDLPEIQRARETGKVKADVFVPGQEKIVHHGELTFLDNTIDRATGTIMARATITNDDFGLLPGQYVHIRLAIREEPNALLVPRTALGSSQLGKYVYVVGEGGKVDQRMVSLGPTENDLVVVKGVSENDQIISGNLQKIGPGMPVKPIVQ